MYIRTHAPTYKGCVGMFVVRNNLCVCSPYLHFMCGTVCMYVCVCMCVCMCVCVYVCVCVCMCMYVYVYAVLEIRSKRWMNKCPSIIILGQTISDLLGHIFGEAHMCQSRCPSTNNESINRHSQCK